MDGPQGRRAAGKEGKTETSKDKKVEATKRKEKEKEKEQAAPAVKPTPPPAAAQPAPVVQPPSSPAAVQPPAASAQQQASSFAAARALILSGKYEAGIAAMKALGYDDHPDVASSIGFAYAKLGNLNEARAWYSRALAADPNHQPPGAIPARFCCAGRYGKGASDPDRVKAICGERCREYQSSTP